ncbi:unnamed protein product, partial [Heterosigma akashiwo]
SKLVPGDSASNDEFGVSVAAMNDSVLVGAQKNDNKYGGADFGSVYIFTSLNGSWVQANRIVAVDGETSDYFGNSVSVLSDSSYVVGSYGDDDTLSDSGSAYIFTYYTYRGSSSWVQEDKLVASDGSTDDYFGYAVSNLGDSSVLVGAYLADMTPSSNTGAAYVFTSALGSWVQANKVVASDGASEDRLGMSVGGLSSTCFIVGAAYDDELGSNSGSIYVFTSSSGTWVQAVKLTASDGAYDDRLGFGLSGLDSYSFVAGAYGSDAVTYNAGAAYIFTSSSGSWAQVAKVVASDGADSDYFGRSSAGITNKLFAVGAYMDDSSGSAYAFTLEDGSWVQTNKILPEANSSSAYFGFALSGINQDSLVIGASYGNSSQSGGAAYIFTRGSP